MDIWQAKGIIDKGVILLTVEDPSSQVGSGGATLNALLVVTEHICARQGYSVRIPTCFSYCFLQCALTVEGGYLQPVSVSQVGSENVVIIFWFEHLKKEIGCYMTTVWIQCSYYRKVVHFTI